MMIEMSDDLGALYDLLQVRVRENPWYTTSQMLSVMEAQVLLAVKQADKDPVLDRDLGETTVSYVPKKLREWALAEGEKLGLVTKVEWRGKPGWRWIGPRGNLVGQLDHLKSRRMA